MPSASSRNLALSVFFGFCDDVMTGGSNTLISSFKKQTYTYIYIYMYVYICDVHGRKPYIYIYFFFLGGDPSCVVS